MVTRPPVGLAVAELAALGLGPHWPRPPLASAPLASGLRVCAPSCCLLVIERAAFKVANSTAFGHPGTGFWAQDSLGHRVEAPAIVLRPPAGTALLFGGHVTHAGMPVTAGERAVFVASFSLRGGAAARVEAAAQSRDIYGDLL